MAMTLREVLERLKELDEVDLLEILGVNSEMLLERFIDIVEDKIDKLEIEMDWE